MGSPSRVFAALMPSTVGDLIYKDDNELGFGVPTQLTVQRQSHNGAREVHVTGIAESSRQADRGRVRISVYNTKESVNDVTNSVSRRLEYILQTIRQHGVKDEATSVRRHLYREDDLYHMDAEVMVEFSDFVKMENLCHVLLEKLDKSVCVGSPQFYHSTGCLSQLRRHACVSAVENAHHKACEVSCLLGQTLGHPLLVREEETKEWRNDKEEEEGEGVRGGGTHPQPPHRPTVTVSSRVSVSFSLRPRDRAKKKL